MQKLQVGRISQLIKYAPMWAMNEVSDKSAGDGDNSSDGNTGEVSGDENPEDADTSEDTGGVADDDESIERPEATATPTPINE